jgi:ElaB/YqjD/DUF883 family membrane-anchored ribosome-binding protein
LKRLSGNERINVELGNKRGQKMTRSVLDRTGEQIAETARKASRAASAIGDAFEDGVGVAQRAAKQGGDAAEEFLDDTTKRLQRHPVETVVTTFAVGVAVGIVIGWMLKRR